MELANINVPSYANFSTETTKPLNWPMVEIHSVRKILHPFGKSISHIIF